MSEPYHPPPALVGSHVGNYVVERKIGQGGMGEVYLARHPELGREVAVKILTGALAADESAIGRFRQEAMAACRIGHDAIVEILDIGQLADGRHYYVMEHLQGQSLHDYLEGAGPIEPQTCLEILQPVVAALAAAHSVGIVHRDIKPDNIFLAQARDGSLRVKVLDFGIAKLLDTTVPPLVATRTGALLGTPLFMSPEQCAGNGDIGPAADIYSVGAMAFNLLTGRPPFIGQGMGEVLVQHMQAPPPSLRDFRPELDDSLDRVLQCALAKRPAERFQSIAALGAALESAIPGASPTTASGGATLRLSEAAASVPMIPGQSGDVASAQSGDVASAPRILSQTSLSAAASEYVPLPVPASAPPPNPGVYRILVFAIMVGLLIGAGAVIAGVYLGRSPTHGPPPQGATGTTKSAAIVQPSPSADAGAPRPAPAVLTIGGSGFGPLPATAPAGSMPARTLIPLPPPPRRRSFPLARPRAAAAPPGSKPYHKKPNSTQIRMAKKWLKEALRLKRQGKCNIALSKARSSYRYFPSTTAIRIIGHCGCWNGFRRDARWAYGLLSRKDKRALKAYCAQKGITLP